MSPARPKVGWILSLGAIVAIGPLSIDMYLPALPALQRHFATGTAETQLTLAAFFVGIAAGQLLYGPLSDRFGRRVPMLGGLAVYTIASLCCAFAPRIEALIALRLLQALGGCAGMVITRAIVRDHFAAEDMARILSQLVLVMGAAPMLAPLAGSAVLKVAGWQAIFLLLAAFGALCIVLTLLLTESHAAERRLRTLSLRSVVHGYVHLLKHRKFVGYALAGGVAQGGMFSYISASAFVFIDGYGLSPAGFSALFGANAAGLIVASQLNALVLRRQPAQYVLTVAIRTYLGAAVLMLLSALSGVGGMAGIALPLFACLTCLGFTFPNSIAAAMAPFGDRAGSASALLGTLQFTLAGIASIAVAHLPAPPALAMAGIITTCGTASLLLLRYAARPDEPPV